MFFFAVTTVFTYFDLLSVFALFLPVCDFLYDPPIYMYFFLNTQQNEKQDIAINNI